MSFELLCLVVLAYLVFGPRKLPEIARFFAKTMTEIRRAGNEFRYSLEDEVRKLEAETKQPPQQLEAAPKVEGAVARPDAVATTAGVRAEAVAAETSYAAEDEEQWYESDWDWEENGEAVAPETAPAVSEPAAAAAVAETEAVPPPTATPTPKPGQAAAHQP